jgi:uncharacterized repeat protein (TIGR03803 family)
LNIRPGGCGGIIPEVKALTPKQVLATPSAGRCPMRVKSLLLASVLLSAIAVHAQYQYTVLHAFGFGSDGGGVWDSVVFDAQGNLYGTTTGGGTYGEGTVFELTSQTSGEWTESVLHNFPSSPADGMLPNGGVTLDSFGNLYGATVEGGGGTNQLGMVFELSPAEDGWSERIVHSFGNPGDVACCPWGNLILGQGDNVYGTGGAAFELSSAPDGWIEDVLHNFAGPNGYGYAIVAGPIMDGAGNIYGTTQYGGGRGGCQEGGCGTVYELEPVTGAWAASVAWKERILYSFGGVQRDGEVPGAGQLTMDHVGNLYGTTQGGGATGYGTVFKLTDISSATGGVWAETVLHSFTPGGLGYQPYGGVIFDNAGNLYGTTANGGSALCGCGVVYGLSPQPDGQWQYTVLHIFEGTDGAQPDANLTIGPDGNLYGTTVTGGTYGGGVVFQIQIAP